ncbi:MAG: serine O-acetyltransferase [Clostridiales bacterium]|nr:serine O-acetyltransferase [Clostridiales bacterium]
MTSRALYAIKKDLEAVIRHDPAARSKLEAALCYSGFHALVMYRFFRFLYVHRYFLLARILSALTRFFTGIEIHPGAVIGSGVFIDHGAGVVIGETAVVGDNVVLYQGVTLGGTGKDKGKRHPTVEDGVTICSGAKVLGPFTVGKGAVIGAGSIVLTEVPPKSTVVGIPGQVVRMSGRRMTDLASASPDPNARKIAELEARLQQLEQLIPPNKTNNKIDVDLTES